MYKYVCMYAVSLSAAELGGPFFGWMNKHSVSMSTFKCDEEATTFRSQ